MLRFLKYTLATIVGCFLAFFIGLFILYLFIPSDKVQIEPDSILKLTLQKPILERTIDDPLPDLSSPLNTMKTGISLIDLRESIEKAKRDDKIKGIFLHLNTTRAGFASLEEVRDALIDFKASGKFVYAYGEYLSEGAYYLASIADKIYLNPSGELEFNGLSSSRGFYKGALEKLEVKPEIFRVGKYKSAVEPFFLEKMSEASRKQTASYLNSIYDFYLKNISKSRKISITKLRNISNDLLIRNSKDALKYKLITHLGYYDEVQTALRKEIKLKEKDKLKWVDLDTYKEVKVKGKSNTSSNKIAVIVASGEIGSGEGDESSIGSSTIVKELQKARKNKKIKAVVLRINSPGGSALASDVMWREVLLTKKVKPVIASMSDVAASGGYYMAMGCNKIVAQPNTITGSIGIFGILWDARDFFKNKLGVTYDQVNTGKYSDLGSFTRKMTEKEREIIQTAVNQGYADFTKKAAKGRGMSWENLKELASGRVWSGIEAKDNGLVDVLGGFEDAVKIAAKEAKLKEGDYRLRYYPTQKSFLEKIKDQLNIRADAEKMMQEKLGELYPYYKILEELKKEYYLQARMPYDIIIR